MVPLVYFEQGRLMIFLAIVFAIFLFFNLRSDYHLPKWWFLTNVALLMLCWEVSKISLPLATLAAFVSLNTNFNARYSFRKMLDLMLMFDSLNALVGIASCIVIFLYFPPSMIDDVFDLIPVMLFLNVVWKTLPKKWRTWSSYGKTCLVAGIGGNTSIDSTASSVLCAVHLATGSPIELQLVSIISAGACCALNKGIAGSLGVVSTSMAFLFFRAGWPFALVPGIVLLAATWKNRKVHFRPSGRDIIWKAVIAQWWTFPLVRKILGTGQGSFRTFYPRWERIKKTKFEGIAMTWAHNDCLQFVYENGVVGIALVAWLLASMGQMATSGDLILLAGLIPNLFFNFPLRLGPECFVLTLYVRKFFGR